MKTAVIIPTYNESDNIVTLVKEILDLQAVAYIIIVDDNSPDGTGQIADELARQYHEVHVIHRLGKLGLGTAGFRCYRRQVLEVIDLDAIFSSGYSFLVEMLYKCQQLGYCVGSAHYF